jgi:hypothetical protein
MGIHGASALGQLPESTAVDDHGSFYQQPGPAPVLAPQTRRERWQ